MDRQFIRCGAQGCMTGKCAVLRLVDPSLQMLDAHSHSEGLWLHGCAASQEHFKGIPGAVAYRQKEGVTIQLFLS